MHIIPPAGWIIKTKSSTIVNNGEPSDLRRRQNARDQSTRRPFETQSRPSLSLFSPFASLPSNMTRSGVSPTKRAAESPSASSRVKERRLDSAPPSSPPPHPRAALDYNAYPHILEAVLDVASHSSLLALRGVSRAIRDQIDARLFAHVHAREHDFDIKNSNHNYRDWHKPSVVQLRDAEGHRLPGVRWEEDIEWDERVDAAFKLRALTRTIDVSEVFCFDDQMPLPQDKLRALPDERRHIVREHDANLLRVALSGIHGMRAWEVGGCVSSLPCRTSVQFMGLECPWDGHYAEPMGTFTSLHTDPIEKMVLVVHWDPSLRLLDHATIMWGDDRHRTNSFYRHRNRTCEPKEIVVVFAHDTRHAPDFRLGALGKHFDDPVPPEREEAGQFGMFTTLVEFLGEKLGLVEKITVVGLDTIMPHMATEERGEELHESIREAVTDQWERCFLAVTDRAHHQEELHNDDLYVGQLQSHPEFYRIAVIEYWKVMLEHRQRQGWNDGFDDDPGFGFQMGPNGMTFMLGGAGLLGGMAPLGLDDEMDTDTSGDDEWETDDDIDDDEIDADMDIGIDEDSDEDDEDEDDDSEDSSDSDDETAGAGVPTEGIAAALAEAAAAANALAAAAAGGDGSTNTTSSTPSDGSDASDASHASDILESDLTDASDDSSWRWRSPTPPSPVTIWADEIPVTEEMHDRRDVLSRKVHKARLANEPDADYLKISLDDWYFMASYSRERLPCTEDQIDPEELAALRLMVPPPPPRIDLVRASIDFVSHAEYEGAVGKEVYAWETDGYEWAKHADGCGCGAAPIV